MIRKNDKAFQNIVFFKQCQTNYINRNDNTA